MSSTGTITFTPEEGNPLCGDITVEVDGVEQVNTNVGDDCAIHRCQEIYDRLNQECNGISITCIGWTPEGE